MAAAMPSTSRLGTMLVNSEPGPRAIRSASAMAVRAAGMGRTLRGRRRMDWMRCLLRLMRVSPTMTAPLARVASSETLAGRHGKSVGEIAQDLGEGHEEEVAEAVALESAAGWEAVLEEAGQQGRVFAEGDHAVADVARGEHVGLPAQASGAAAVVGHGDDGGDVHGRRRGAGGPGVVLQPLQDTGQSGAAADGDYAEWRLVFHVR